MKKRVFAVIMAMALVTSVFTGCGKEAGESQSTDPVVEDQVEQSADTEEPPESAEAAAEAETSDDGMKQLEAIGDVDVDKGLFNVTLTIPKDFVGETTQEKLDESVKEKGYKSATLNSDGSVTYVMT